MSASIPPLLKSVGKIIESTKETVDSALSRRPLPDFVVFSHLRWEFVKQRPQHILSRFAKNSKIIFVEEPVALDDHEYGSVRRFLPEKNVIVIQPRINQGDWNALQTIVRQELAASAIEDPLLWFYSPSFVEMARKIEHSLIVFDVMDELSAFKGASPEILKQEKEMLRLADVVFTGGKSLYEAKKTRHENVHCFPSSVDRAHFEAAKDATNFPVPAELTGIETPIAGFYGVIDERLDLDLLAATADMLPGVTFVIVGPVVKIDPASLPLRSNIIYPGGRNYDQLPQYLAYFDVAIMPFALNESTKFISPTKTLEFMAALKPIVSTPIYDVARDYSREVLISDNAQKFAESITKALYETPSERYERESLQKAVLARTSWNTTVSKMHGLIDKALAEYERLEELDGSMATDASAVPDISSKLGYSV